MHAHALTHKWREQVKKEVCLHIDQLSANLYKSSQTYSSFSNEIEEKKVMVSNSS